MKPAIQKPFLIFVVDLIFRNWLLHLQEQRTISKSLLDTILSSNLKLVQKAKVLRSSISDHDLFFAVLRLKKARPQATYITTRSFKNYSPDAFSNDVSQIPWSCVETLDDVDDKLHDISRLYTSCLGIYVV